MTDYSLLMFFAPSLVLGLLLCVAYASLYHLWGGRSSQDLLLFLVAAGAGFVFGQMMGVVTQVPWFQIGQLHLLEATMGAWLLLFGVQSIRA